MFLNVMFLSEVIPLQ